MDTTTAESPDTASDMDTSLVNPFDAHRESTAPDTEAPEATPVVAESEPAALPTTDQSTTPEPIQNPLAAALQPPVEASKADPFAALPPELQSLVRDPVAFANKAKHWQNLESLAGRQGQELGTLRQQAQQFQGIDPQQARAVLAEREQAAKIANLQPYNRGHPKNGEFRSTRETRRFIESAVSDVAPENQASVKAALMAKLSPEQRDMMNSYDAYAKAEQDMTPEDREDRMHEQIDARVNAGIQRAMQYQEQTRRTQEFIAKNPTLMTEHQDLLARALDDNTPRSDLAAEIATLKRQLADATGQRAKDVRVVETAKARDQIVKQTAVIGRDGHTGQRRADPMKVAKDAAASGESVLQALARQQAEHRTPEL